MSSTKIILSVLCAGAAALACRDSGLAIAANAEPATVVSPGLAQGTPQPAIAYDAIVRIIISGTPPPPGEFAVDADRIAKLPPPHYSTGMGAATAGRTAGFLSGLLSAIPGIGSLIGVGVAMAAGQAANAAQNKMQADNAAESRALMSAGWISRLAYYNGWSRNEIGPHITIVKPDQGLTMVIDSTTHSYTAKTTPPDLPTYYVDDATPAPSISIVGAPVFASLPATTIEQRSVRGYHLSGSVETTSTVGWCDAGKHDIDLVEYVADIPDPDNPSKQALDASSVLANACRPSSSASDFETGRLVVYRSLSIRPSTSGDLTLVYELGDIRSLSDRDAALFSAPTDFTEEK